MKNIQEIFYKRKDLSGKFDTVIAAPRLNLMRQYLGNALKAGEKRIKVLDIGCADGEIFRNYTKEADFVGVDISATLLKKAAANGYKTTKVDLNKKKLPFKNSSFDIVIAGEVIEHIVNTDFILSEMNRVLKKGGKIILSVPNLNHWISYFMLFVFDLPPRASARYKSFHVRDFTFKLIRKMLKEYAFKILSSSGTGFYTPIINRNFFINITKHFPRLGSEIVILAYKEKKVKYQEQKAVTLTI